jgi:hypothetical protein
VSDRTANVKAKRNFQSNIEQLTRELRNAQSSAVAKGVSKPCHNMHCQLHCRRKILGPWGCALNRHAASAELLKMTTAILQQ